MLTVSNFSAKYVHCAETIDADKAIVAVIVAENAATVACEPILVADLVLLVVTAAAASAAALAVTP